ncbi:MAG TPA: hypothetical protein D7H85_06765 [Candidatus Poseidoniales archaeon]|nr:MAG TPA: hypothetical protein D7H85_06765 [Candidatus Poseidoniales archaeon]
MAERNRERSDQIRSDGQGMNGMERPLLHGTDGIRGAVKAAPMSDLEALKAIVEKREVNGRAFMLLGMAFAEVLKEDLGRQPKIVIGWDRRPGNAMLVSGLTDGLHQVGAEVIHGGLVATPGLHNSVIGTRSDAGLMVTASHNPSSDSGVKFFDAEGRKSMPVFEQRVADTIWRIADLEEDREPDPELCLPDKMVNAERGHRNTLAKRFDGIANDFALDSTSINWTETLGTSELLLDSSGGSAAEWFATGLARRGIPFREISDVDSPLNENCGAGDLSPTDSWTWKEMQTNEHKLLRELGDLHGNRPPSAGSLIGAALDGDGDRCLLIEAMDGGAKVVDGDQMADDLMRAWSANGIERMTAAFSIETDLALTASIARLRSNVIIHECAVGDRWLTQALRAEDLSGASWPKIIGAEDSGHLVLASPHPVIDDEWSLVGDGAATLISQLMARAALNTMDVVPAFTSGWKRRVSIRDTDRSRWTGVGPITDRIEEIILISLKGREVNLERKGIEGESGLFLLRGDIDGIEASFGIRNSGTEAKTSLSIRAKTEINGLEEIAEKISDLLQMELVP